MRNRDLAEKGSDHHAGGDAAFGADVSKPRWPSNLRCCRVDATFEAADPLLPAHSDAALHGIVEAGRRTAFGCFDGQGEDSRYPGDVAGLRKQFLPQTTRW